MESHHSGRGLILKSTLLYALLNILFISSPYYLLSELPDEEMTISSGEADYDGQSITLEGEVSVHYGLGKISARHLTVLPSEQKGRFSNFIVRDNILIELQGGGQLKCEKAEIDYSLMKGSFLGSEEFPDVIYQNSEKGASSLVIKSQKMETELIRLPLPGDLGLKIKVKDFLAHDQVRIYFNQNDTPRGAYVLTADQACYTPFKTDLNVQGGLIALSSNGSNPYCILINPDGDSIQARRIEFNTVERKAFFTEAKGVLKGMEFEADQVFFNLDDKNQTMTFKGNIKIQEESLKIDTDHEVVINQKTVEGKKKISSLNSSKETNLIYLNKNKEIIHKIVCPGNLLIDHENSITTLDSLKDEKGDVIEGKQVFFEDEAGDMYADRICLNYEWKEKKLIPSAIFLEGSVKILNRFDGHVKESGTVLQQALADRVNYDPISQEIILTAFEGNRVLVFDKVNRVQMSAPALRIRKDLNGCKNSIQGIGDVRFTFIENQMSKEAFNNAKRKD